MIEAIRWLLTEDGPLARRLRRLTKVGLLVILFFALFLTIPFQDFASTLFSAHPLELTLGLLLGIPASFLTAVELTILVRMQGIQLRLFEIFSINLATKFYSLVTPGSIIGSGIRWLKISRPQGMPAESLAALAFFRLLETFLSLAFGLAFFFLSGREKGQSIHWLSGLLFLALLLWIAMTRIGPRISRWILGNIDPEELGPLSAKLFGYLDRFITAIVVYADASSGGIALALLAGVASQLLSILSALFLAASVGVELTFLQMGWVNAVVLLATQFPIALAGGLGLREATLVALLPTLGVSAASALAFSLLQFLRWVFLATLGGLWEAFSALRARSVHPRGQDQPR